MNALATSTMCQAIMENIVGNNSQWFWAFVQAVGVIITLVLILRQIRLQRLSNMLSSLAAFNERWAQKEMKDARRNICTKHNKGTESGDQSAETVAAFFEELGLYLNKGVFDIESVWNLYGDYVENYWPILWPKIAELRKIDKSAYSHFEALWNACDKKSKREGTVQGTKTPEELKEFAEAELKRS